MRSTRRRICALLPTLLGAGCLGAPESASDASSTPALSSWTPTASPVQLPQQDQQGTDIHRDSAFRVYNEDERQHVVGIRLIRTGTDQTVLSGRFVVPESASQRVVGLDSWAEYDCFVRLDGEERRISYDADRGKSLTLLIVDGEPSLDEEYTE